MAECRKNKHCIVVKVQLNFNGKSTTAANINLIESLLGDE